jgi:hypothetical protein
MRALGCQRHAPDWLTDLNYLQSPFTLADECPGNLPG